MAATHTCGECGFRGKESELEGNCCPRCGALIDESTPPKVEGNPEAIPEGGEDLA